MSAVDICVPKITLGGVKKSQWMNSTDKTRLKTKKEACKRYLQTLSDSDDNLYVRARNQARKVCRTAAKNFEKKKILLKMQKRIRKPSFCSLFCSARQTTVYLT
jgi:hypothetical protein